MQRILPVIENDNLEYIQQEVNVNLSSEWIDNFRRCDSIKSTTIFKLSKSAQVDKEGNEEIRLGSKFVNTGQNY